MFENDLVRVLGYPDVPGDKTPPHPHRRFVLDTLSAFRRRLPTCDGT